MVGLKIMIRACDSSSFSSSTIVACQALVHFYLKRLHPVVVAIHRHGKSYRSIRGNLLTNSGIVLGCCCVHAWTESAGGDRFIKALDAVVLVVVRTGMSNIAMVRSNVPKYHPTHTILYHKGWLSTPKPTVHESCIRRCCCWRCWT
jgi:hypothetical protein